MAAEGGGSELDSQRSDDHLQKIIEEETLPNGTETIEQNSSVKGRTQDASTSRVSSGGDPEETETRLCGWLNKCGNIGFVKTTKLLWFVFSDDTCKLYFYRNPQDLLPLGEIDIKHASFHFDANQQKPGLFEIRSDGKVYHLDAHDRHRMTDWLEALQKKRRLYSVHRKMISSEKMSWTLKTRRKGSGLTGDGKEDSKEGTSDESDHEVLTEGHSHTTYKPITGEQRSSSYDNLDGGDPPAASLQAPPLSKTRYFSLSLSNLRSEILDVVSSVRTQISPTSSASGEGREDWTLLDDMDSTSSSEPSPAPPPHTTTTTISTTTSTSTTTSNSGTRLGGKFAKMFKSGKRSQSESSSLSKESGSKKVVYQPDAQTCFKCRVLQGDILSLREDLKAAEEETQANREIVKLLQKELDVMRVNRETRKEGEGKSDSEKDLMLQQRDKHVVELEHSLATLHEEKGYLEQQAKLNESSQKSLQEQVAMLKEMLIARDEQVVDLTRQKNMLENDRGQGQEKSEEPQPSIPMTNMRELQMLKDSVQAYQLQNNFLTKEILELNELRKMDEKREKELLMDYTKLNAEYYKTRSKYLYLLTEKKEPVRGGEEVKSQEVVSQLLKEVLDTDAVNATSDEVDEGRQPFLSSHSMEYDRYGFLICGGDEETDDVLVAKANILQRQCEEISNRVKDVDETTSKHVKWENFMVGQLQSGKPLARSPELKSLIRLGVPHEYREHIWKGCINFYVAQTRDKLGPMYYKKDLGERIKNSKSNPAVKQIELDLLRTLPNNRHFDSMESDGIPKLRRVLLSYSVHNPLIGYCQGLNRLAAIALLFLSEEESFWCLEAVVEHLMPKDYYTITLAAAQADQRVLKELVAEKLPKLHTHFEQHDVDLSLYTFNWFLTIFVDNIRPETFLRCWDVLLYEGSKVLFRFGLAFLKYAEDEILTLKEAPHIYRYMRMLGEKVTSVKKIAQIAFHELNPFPMRTVSSKRAYHIQMVREELRELDIIRQDFQSSHSPGVREGYVSDDDLDLDDTHEEEEEEEGEGNS